MNELKTFQEYLDAVRTQAKKHGQSSLSARSESNPKYMLHYLGFQSPDGWFTIELRNLKKAFVTNKLHESEITLPSGTKIKKCSRIPPNEVIIREFVKQVEEAMA